MGVLRVGSLFSGIGGFDLGLQRTGGFETVWFCEQDEFCQRVLAKHWPRVPCYDDVRELGARTPRVDLLCGGFPCQDISIAGRGAGLAGARSGLWFEFARLIGELEPRWVVVENVPALRRRGLSQVLADLDACGYDAEWDGLSAAAFGAPHRRDRIWIVAYPQRDSLREQPRRSGGQDRQGEAQLGLDGEAGAVANTNSSGSQGHGRPFQSAREFAVAEGGGAHREGASLADVDGSPWDGSRLSSEKILGPETFERLGRCGSGEGHTWATEPDVGRVAHGVPNRVDRLRALGNALVPQIAEWIGDRILEAEGLK